MIFHNDTCNIIRQVSDTINNHLTTRNETVYKNIPCHLSFSSLNAINQTDSKAFNLQTFKLYISSSLNVKTELNDIVEITTDKGQQYKLYAGTSARYPLTLQVQLERNKIV